jgi:hypothetical protein
VCLCALVVGVVTGGVLGLLASAVLSMHSRPISYPAA